MEILKNQISDLKIITTFSMSEDCKGDIVEKYPIILIMPQSKVNIPRGGLNPSVFQNRQTQDE